MERLFINEEEWMDVVKVNGSLDSSNYEIIEFKILKEVSKTNSKVTVLEFRRSDLGLFRDLLGETNGRGPRGQWGQES